MTQLRTFTANQRLVGIGLDPIDLAGTDGIYQPISYATPQAALAGLGLPPDTPYIMWDDGWDHLGEAHAAMSANQVLFLPERDDPYLIDSTNGFMAAGVKEIDGVGSNGLKDGSRIPIVDRAGHWFEMTRARRGIIGFGPGAVIEPSASSFSRQAQPILEDQIEGQKFQTLYYLNGSTQTLNGAQETLIGYDHASPIFANFTLKGRSFGGVAYSGIKPTGGTQSSNTFKRIRFDECWRSHDGVPNGETGCLTLNRGTYLIENCDIITPKNSVSGGSCIMWNNNTGGTVRNVRADVTSLPSNMGGMWTFWRCGGVNTFENVHVRARQSGINIEENLAGFELNWTGGTLSVDYPGNKFHLIGNPSGGPAKVSLVDVDVSPNGYTTGALTFSNYAASAQGKRSWVTCNTMPVSCVPSNKWID